ncbi:hypothetical protein ACQPUY_15705 [Clostridium nigeriense]|uniref:hypothetical protein n=1 Tax=Clostridium nigeriense TaxID=1805470 RepID=UPI003D355B60
MSNFKDNILNSDEFEIELNNSDIEKYKEINYSDEIKRSCLQILNKIEIDNSPIETIDLNINNFKNYHYKLMSGKFLVIYPNKSTIKYITSDGLCFNCSDEKLIKLISDIPKPLKISFKHSDETTMPLILIIKILYGKDIKNIQQLVDMFAYNNFNKSELNCYRALIPIYKKLFDIINKHSYITYINKERDLYLIEYRAYMRSLELDDGSILKSKEFELDSYLNKLISIDNFCINKSNLLYYLENNTDLPISLYEGISNIEFLKLYKTYCEVISLKNLTLDNYIPNSYSLNGTINDTYPFNYFIQKRASFVIKGTFPDIYFNTLLNILRLKHYIISGDSDNHLINYIKTINPDLEYSLITTILLVLEAYICQFTSIEDIKNYLYIHKSTLLFDDEIEVFLSFIKENLSDLVNAIDIFNNETYKSYEVKLIEHIPFSPLNTRLNYLSSKTIKSTMLAIYKDIEDFNFRNKKKIYITDITKDSIYIVVDEDISHIAIDILNRTMINTLKSNLKLDSYTCYTDIL